MKKKKPTKAASQAARLLQRRRKTWTGAGGRKEILTKCPHCKQPFGARKMRAHKPVCPDKPDKS